MKTILFDMDGTLTPPRQKMSQLMCQTLAKLQKADWNIGIVSGSDIDYILEQCEVLTDINAFDYTDFHIYPCNGTKYYHYNQFGKLTKVYENNFKNHIGENIFAELIYSLFNLISRFNSKDYRLDIPLTGNFVDCRGSTINFSPIGRKASQEERSTWIKLDKEFNIRESLLNSLKKTFDKNKIEFKLGGETSIDICPAGWDKTYVLKNFQPKDEIWFIGDKCEVNGNDKALYDAVKLRMNGGSFKTTGPNKTMAIINNRILQHPNQFKR